MTQTSGIEVRFSANTAPLEQGVAKAQGALRNFQAAANDAVPSAMGSRIQNVGFQMQDFAVQVASGTSATRAFAQQAPQLLSGFGTLGVVLGTVAAVAIPLAAHFIDLGAAAQVLGDNIQTVGPYALAATAALAGFYAPSILAGIATTTTAIGTGLVGAIKAVTAAMMANPLGLLVAGVAAAAVALYAFRDDVKQVIGVDLIGTVKTSVNFMIDAFVRAGRVIGVAWGSLGDIVGNAVVSAANIALGAITNLVNKGIQGINRLIDAVNSLGEYTGLTIQKFAEIDPMQFANSFAEGAAAAGSEIGRIMAEKTATDYVGALGQMASDAMSQVGSMFSGFGGATDAATGKDGKGDKADPTSVAPSQEPGRAFADRLEMIRDQFKTEREVLEEEYALNQQVLDNALFNKQLREEEHRSLTEQLEQQHQDNLSNIRRNAMGVQLDAAASLFGSLAQMTDGSNKKLMRLSKAFSAAQVVINTAQGISKAFAQFGWPAGIGPAAAVAASGAAQLASIASAESGRIRGVRGGGGGGGGSTTAAGGGGGGGAASPGPTTTFRFTLVNDPLGFGEKFARQFIDQLNSTQRNGGQIRGVIA